MPTLLRRMLMQARVMAPEGGDGGNGGGGGGGGDGGGNQPHVQPTVPGKEVFSREYVQELRSENASYRTRAIEAEKKAQEAIDKATTAQAEADAKVAKAAADADAKVKDTHTAAEQRIIRAELKTEAVKAGMVDMDGLKLADLSSITIDEKGEVVGGAELMKALKESKPYLFKEVTSTSHNGNPPPKDPPKAFNARTATPEEIAAKAKEMGVTLKTH